MYRYMILILIFSFLGVPHDKSVEKDIFISSSNFSSAENIIISDPANGISSCYRVTFGLTDEKPKSWDGELIPYAGQKIIVKKDRLGNNIYKGFSINSGPEPKTQNDQLLSDTSWILSTRRAPNGLGTDEWVKRTETPETIIRHPSIFIYVLEGDDKPVRIKTVSGEFQFDPSKVLVFEPELFLEGSVRVERVPQVTTINTKSTGEQDFPSIVSTKSGEVWVSWQEYHNSSDGEFDFIYVSKQQDGKWMPATTLVEKADVFRSAVGEDENGDVWIIWSMQVDGNWDLYGRKNDGEKWSKIKRLTKNVKADIYHKVVTDSEGKMWLVWQRDVDGYSQIFAKYYNGKEWSSEQQVSVGKSAEGNNWWPNVAAEKEDGIVVVWDGYASGNYDIYMSKYEDNHWTKVEEVIGGENFQAHPTVAVDSKNRIWISWDQSGPQWGKDTGFLVEHKGTQLHASRSIGILCIDGNRKLTTKGSLTDVLKKEDHWELPQLQIDNNGNPWLFVRHLIKRAPNTIWYAPIYSGLWENYAIKYDGEKWQELMYLPYSSGRNDMMPASTIDLNGQMWVTWATDNRDFNNFLPCGHQIEIAKMENVKSGKKLYLKPYETKYSNYKMIHPQEKEQVQRIRSYRIKSNGKTYLIYRGDLHRHSDISKDGLNDGSLLDAYRYAKDAASLDFLGVTNHLNGGVDNYYSWWRTQKIADIFQSDGSFATFYSYERSVEYPNGHRNVFFIKRGEKVLSVPAFEKIGWEGAKSLYWYLHQNNGFCISHTTGRTSGTDWRDYDSEVEPLVEIYQGMRDAYEYPGAPRPKKKWKEFLDRSKPIPRASSDEKAPRFRRAGFIWNALEKGIKFGFIASSDHISTHISYACFIAEELNPESLMEAAKARRTYAATDNIILDIRFVGSDGEHLMGAEFESEKPIEIKTKVIGTATIQQIDIIKNNKIVHTLKPKKSEIDFEFVDSSPEPGESYFYVRVVQEDGEMAWGSPIWVTYK